MPAPVAAYVLAVVGTVAAGIAFKEFVYEPHIAPRIERWAEEFLAKREARRQKRAGLPVPVPSSPGAAVNAGIDKNKRSGEDGAGAADDGDSRSTYELETLVAHEVQQWRSNVPVAAGPSSGLRQRKNAGSTISTLDESNSQIPYSPMTPTHVLFDDALTLASSPSGSPTSSRVPTPSPHSTLSHSTFRTPPPFPPQVQAPPTPDPSAHGSPAPSVSARDPSNSSVSFDPSPPHSFFAAPSSSDPFLPSPHHIPSLSLSHPVDLDAEHDLELLSAASSSPRLSVSSFSGMDDFHSFAQSTSASVAADESPFRSPEFAVRSVSSASSEGGSDAEDLERWSNTGSEISASSWSSAGAGRGAGR